MSDGLKLHKSEIHFLFTTDCETKKIHKQFLGKNATTDVITFVDEKEINVVICLDQAWRQAHSRGLELFQEVLLLMIHALLHATGFDDLTQADALKMRQQEFAWVVKRVK